MAEGKEPGGGWKKGRKCCMVEKGSRREVLVCLSVSSCDEHSKEASKGQAWVSGWREHLANRIGLIQ